MKITGKPHFTAKLELLDLKPRRKTRNPSLIRLRRPPETPLLKWKTQEDKNKDNNDRNKNVGVEVEEGSGRHRSFRRRDHVSARKLAVGLWRLQLPHTVHEVRRRDQLGFQKERIFQVIAGKTLYDVFLSSPKNILLEVDDYPALLFYPVGDRANPVKLSTKSTSKDLATVIKSLLRAKEDVPKDEV